MGEVQYIWADPASPQQQVALSSIVQAMYEKGVYAIARWTSKDGMDPKMGVLAPNVIGKIDFFLWVQVCLRPLLTLSTKTELGYARCRLQMTSANTLSPHSRISSQKAAKKLQSTPISRQKSNLKLWTNSLTQWTLWTQARKTMRGAFLTRLVYSGLLS